MHTRSKSSGSVRLADEANPNSRTVDTALPYIRDRISLASTKGLTAIITSRSLHLYHVPPRELQVESVIHLVRGSNTFLLAGTGYGKTRVAELYYSLHTRKSQAIVLVLNPLDALGDNQASLLSHLGPKLQVSH